MSYCGYVTTLKNLHKHPNADRLLLGECFGNTVCVSLDYAEGEIGVYFPTDGQLSVEFAEQNNLLRKKDENGKNIGGYMDPDKRNVTSIRLRGEKSDGLFLPLSCLTYTGVNMDELNPGDTITIVNGHHICQKYIPRGHVHTAGPKKEGNRTRKRKVPIAPLFVEHADTEQLAYNMDAFKSGDLIEITLKMHGTSQRTAYVPKFQGYKRTLLDRILRREGTPIYDWGYVTGTRRTVLGDFEEGGFYGSNAFREHAAKFFEGKLHKGEAVYYEVVGFTDNGRPIMGDADNKKLNDKEFVKQYGDITRFSYGCDPDGLKTWYGRDDEGHFALQQKVPVNDFYVYRMTMTNEDGDIVEYTPDFMRYRCEQMGCKAVIPFWTGYIKDEDLPIVFDLENFDETGKGHKTTPGEYIRQIAEEYYDGPDPVGKTHVREGVVIRIVNRPKFTAYKHKNFSFKVLEGIVKASAEAPDMEEAEELVEENQE